jgi:hypothetical protein
MKQKSIVILGIVAIIAIVLMVLLIQNVMTAEAVRRYPETGLPIMYPTSIARVHCELPEPALDQTAYACRRIGVEECNRMHGTPNRITVCQQHCMFEIQNICEKARGTKGIGMAYTYEPRMGLRRPVNT